MKKENRDPNSQHLTRRQFLELTGFAGLSLLLANCRPPSQATANPEPGLTPFPALEDTPTALPTAAPTAAPTASPTPAFKSQVATARTEVYEPAQLRVELERMFDDLGGLKDLLRPGARVGIKPNLTGETWTDAGLPVPATELFVTHPALVQALAEICLDAGVSSITIMDGLGDPLIFERWGYRAVADALGISLVDLCLPAPYASFTTFPVGGKFSVYDSFQLNPSLGELDVFISAAKMKCHSTTGVTLSLKNLFGIAPISLYRNSSNQNYRASFHGEYAFDRRVPRVITDLHLARPVHLAIIDGIATAEGGAGAWDTGYTQVKPGVLVASRDPVAADTVASAIMGFDPAAPSGSPPFLYADNHLELAQAAGLGTHLLDEIGIAGPSIEELLHPFRPVQRT